MGCPAGSPGTASYATQCTRTSTHIHIHMQVLHIVQDEGWKRATQDPARAGWRLAAPPKQPMVIDTQQLPRFPPNAAACASPLRKLPASLTSSEAAAFAGCPLLGTAVDVVKYVARIPAATSAAAAATNARLDEAVGGLRSIADGTGAIAVKMLDRMQADSSAFDKQRAAASTPGLLCLPAAALASVESGSSSGPQFAAAAMQTLARLQAELVEVRQADEAAMRDVATRLVATLNEVPAGASGGDADQRLLFILGRYRGDRSWVSLEDALGILLADKPTTELQRRNPFLDEAAANAALDDAALVMLHASRVSHAATCSAAARRVQKAVRALVVDALVAHGGGAWSEAAAERAARELGHDWSACVEYLQTHSSAVQRLEAAGHDAATASALLKMCNGDEAAVQQLVRGGGNSIAVDVQVGTAAAAKASSAAPVVAFDPARHTITISQLAASLAGLLSAKRHYMEAADGAFDARFLVFEFLFGYMLRKSQVCCWLVVVVLCYSRSLVMAAGLFGAQVCCCGARWQVLCQANADGAR